MRTATAASALISFLFDGGGVGHLIEPLADVLRLRKATGETGELVADRIAGPAELRQHAKGCLVGDVVADEYRTASRETAETASIRAPRCLC